MFLTIHYREIDKVSKIAKELCTTNRIKHIEGVANFIQKLASIHSLDQKSCMMLAWGHDLFRDFNEEGLFKLAEAFNYRPNALERDNPILLHGKIAALYLRKIFCIDDDIFQSIYWHVSGHPDLPVIGKALLIADMAEENRDFPEVNIIRRSAFCDLEKTFITVIRLKMIWALRNNLYILPETVTAWNRLLVGGVTDGYHKDSE